MKALTALAGLALMSTAFLACDDNSNIGTSVISDAIDILVDSTEVITVRQTDRVEAIQSRTIQQLLGVIDSKDYGALTSDVLTQFMPANELITEGVTVDGLTLTFYVPNGSYVGDSVIPMGLNVYTLDKQLPSPIFSNADPSEYYNEDNLIASKMYNVAAIGVSDSIAALSYRTIDVELPLSLAQSLFDEYKNNPATYQSPSAFAKFFPGIYVKNTFGSGRVVSIDQTVMTMKYRREAKYTNRVGEERDTVYDESANYFAVTPEIITNNNIAFNPSASIADRIAAGEKILLAPLGYDVSFTFPINGLLKQYRNTAGLLSVVNTLSMQLPVEEIPNDFGITPPETVLLVLASDFDKFFADNNLPDNVTSFLATYDSDNHCYTFAGLRSYFLEMLAKDNIEAKDYNFILTPVTANYESNSSSGYYYYQSTQKTLTSVVPYVSRPTMAKLNFKDAKIKLTYSKQSTSF